MFGVGSCDAVVAIRRSTIWYQQGLGTLKVRFDPPLDPGIAHAVEVLRAVDVETFESCQGGQGHAYAAPTVRFYGHRDEGFRALAAALQRGLPVSELRRTWPIYDGEPTGPYWEIVFREVAT